jgi:hypothetical protein
MLDKESIRCLRILSKEHAQLEWPCRNATIPSLIDRGYARKVILFESSWGNRMHDCIEIAITDMGRKALQKTPGV